MDGARGGDVVRVGGLVARIAYGALFFVAVPVGLVAWARATEPVVDLPPVRSVPAGVGLIAFGLLLLGAGARELIVRGRGLPMNPIPPRRLVRTGISRWIRNPLDIGFRLACAGVALAAGSAAGLWLVTPTGASPPRRSSTASSATI
jgi:protein-S-isoprenylcysteine O-methyltransferase Ste14